jgi:hypothetical protein
MAARSLLNKLEARGLGSLPPRRRWPVPRLALQPRSNLPGEPISQPLAQLIPLQFLLLLPGQPERATFANYLAAYHYLPYAGPVGENCQFLVREPARANQRHLSLSAPPQLEGPPDRCITVTNCWGWPA